MKTSVYNRSPTLLGKQGAASHKNATPMKITGSSFQKLHIEQIQSMSAGSPCDKLVVHLNTLGLPEFHSLAPAPLKPLASLVDRGQLKMNSLATRPQRSNINLVSRWDGL